MEDNNINNNDSSRVIMLVSLIIVVSILLIGFVFIAVMDLTRKQADSVLKTTTRRTVKKTEKGTNIISDDELEKLEEITSTTTTIPEIENSTTKTKVTTKKVAIQTTTTTKTTETTKSQSVIPFNEYKIATGATTYPDALDSWEWEIVNLINEERRKNGLNELLVAEDFRQMAEDAAYLYYTTGDDAVKSYLANYSNLRMYSNLNIDAKTLYTNTLNSTKVTTNPYLRYVGVGVLLKNTGLNTYFYVIIYE